MPVLAVDLGGTKILAALVEGAQVIARAEAPTDRGAGPGRWVAQMAELARNWSGAYACAGLSVTGLIRGGQWRALNTATLNLPDTYPLAQAASAALGVPVHCANDAQAAAWGEFRHGAGAGRDMVFLTVSTGIGGGVVAGGRLLAGAQGLAGSVGQVLSDLGPDAADDRFEDAAAGLWIARAAGVADARAAFAAAAADPAGPAAAAIAQSAGRVARLCRNLQLLFDPGVIVIGGGVGLAPGYLPQVEGRLAALSPPYRPTLSRAALGPEAGVIGIAALATDRLHERKD